MYCTYLYCTHYSAYIKAVPCINLIAEYIIQSYFAHFQSLFSLSLLILNNSHGGLINEPGTVSSIFWGKNIEPLGSINDAPDNSALSNSNGASKSKLSNSGFALRFSFNLSESTSPLHHVMLLKVLQRLLSVLMEKLYRKILIFMLQRYRTLYPWTMKGLVVQIMTLAVIHICWSPEKFSQMSLSWSSRLSLATNNISWQCI